MKINEFILSSIPSFLATKEAMLGYKARIRIVDHIIITVDTLKRD